MDQSGKEDTRPASDPCAVDDAQEDEAIKEIRLRVAAAFSFEPRRVWFAIFRICGTVPRSMGVSGGMFSPTSSVFGQYFHSDQPAAAAVATSTASAVTQSASTTASVSPLNPDRVRVRAKGLRGEYNLEWAAEVFQPVLQSHGLAPTEENIAPGSRYSTLETKSKRWKNTYMVDFYISRQLYNALPMPNGEYLWHDGQGSEVVVKKYKRDKSAAREKEREERRKERLGKAKPAAVGDDNQDGDATVACDTDHDGGP